MNPEDGRVTSPKRIDFSGILRIMHPGALPISVTSSAHGANLYLESILDFPNHLGDHAFEMPTREQTEVWVNSYIKQRLDGLPNYDFNDSAPGIDTQTAQYGVFIDVGLKHITTRSLNGLHKKIIGGKLEILTNTLGYTHRHETYQEALSRIEMKSHRSPQVSAPSAK